MRDMKRLVNVATNYIYALVGITAWTHDGFSPFVLACFALAAGFLTISRSRSVWMGTRRLACLDGCPHCRRLPGRDVRALSTSPNHTSW